MTSTVGPLLGEEATIPPVYHNAGPDTYMVDVFHSVIPGVAGEPIAIPAKMNSRADEVVTSAIRKLALGNPHDYELTEVFSSGGQIVKERRLHGNENPVKIQLLWPRLSMSSTSSISSDTHQPGYNFMLRRKEPQQKAGIWVDSAELNPIESFLTRFLQQPRNREYQDLCNLPDLNETTLLENLKKRFNNGMIYTYVGSILISINPFRFFPIYNPKYVRMYQNRNLSDLPPHIFAIADSAYHAMMKTRANQCIVISGESGSGKTESTNLLLHHLSALSQRGFYSDGIEQSILGVGPVLEAFGNAKTVHNNNSSRFGKFVQVNYRANGSVHGASVEKYLLEKSRIVSQASNERNYHVFYYLLAGASPADIDAFCLGAAREYFYLNQNDCYRLEGLESDSEALEFARLRHAMDVVGFSLENQHRIFTVLSAVLHVGNIEFKKKSEAGYQDEAVTVKNMKEITVVSKLLKVKEATLTEALTKRKTMAGGDVVVMSYRMAEAISTRDAMSKCLYSALFDWIVFQINAALVSKHDRREHEGNSIGVLDIFGFEDFHSNSFEQFCINYANESLHYYFNQHIFKFEQEEYMREGIQWKNIEFIDNTECLDLFSKKPTGLLYLLDEECNFPGATNDTLLNKFKTQHQNTPHFEVPPTRQSAFSIVHYAGKVKYHIQDFREKNSDLMRHDILVLLKNSNMAFLRELIGQDPLAVLRWALVRSFFRACFAFMEAGKRHRKSGSNVMRFGGLPRTEQPHKRNPLLSESRKNKVYRPRFLAVRHLRDMETNKNSGPGKIQLGMRTSKNKGKPRSISAQFHNSLQRLMETLNQANPFFIRCIKSNAEKAPCVFDEELVQRQLRYTGMLATVKIRQSGYNYRLSFEDFIYQYHLLLPNGRRSSRNDIVNFLHGLDLNQENYQIGATKVFLRETEKLLLEDALHQALLLRIKRIQHWVRGRLQRRRYLQMRSSAIMSQAIGRGFLARRKASQLRKKWASCVLIQRIFRGLQQRQSFVQKKQSVATMQRVVRGFLARRRVIKEKQAKEELKSTIEAPPSSSTVQQTDELAVNAAIKTDSTGETIDDSGRMSDIRDNTLLETAEKTKKDISQTLADSSVTEKVLSSTDSKEKVRFIGNSDEIQKSTADMPYSVQDENVSQVADKAGSNYDDFTKQANNNVQDIQQDSKISVAGNVVTEISVVNHNVDAVANSAVNFIVKYTCQISQVSDAVDGACASAMKQDLDDSLITAKLPVDMKTPSPEAERTWLDSVSASDSEGRDACPLHTTQGVHSTSSDVYAKELDGKLSSSSITDQVLFSLDDTTPELSSFEPSSTTPSLDESMPKFPRADQSLDDQRYRPTEIDIVKSPSKSAPSSPTDFSGSIFADILKRFPSSLFAGGPESVPLRLKRDNSPLSKRTIEKSQSAFLPNIRTQSGPKDLEIEVKPVIMKASSEEILSTNYQVSVSTALLEKRLRAPLARMESMTDDAIAEEGSVETKTLNLDDDDHDRKRGDLPFQRALPIFEDINGHASMRSPFRRGKKAKKTAQVSKDDVSLTSGDGGYDSGSRKHKPGFMRQRAKHSLPQLPPYVSTPPQPVTVVPPVSTTVSSWSVSGTAQWKYPMDSVVRNVQELRQLEQFFTTKTAFFNKTSSGRKESSYDVIFKEALNEFHSNLITQVSTTLQGNSVTHKYKDLMLSFEKVLLAKARTVKSEEPFPETLVINAFRGFVDEFIKKRDNKELPDVKVKKESVKRKKKKENVLEFHGHCFLQIQFTIPTFCEMCSSIIWVLEKGYVCKVCKLTVHKKCYEKSHSPCPGNTTQAALAARVGATVIGAPLSVLLKDGCQIPAVIERLIGVIEMNGLYTLGLYRKPGNAAQIKQLIKDINSNESIIDYGEYHIHVLTSVLKAFFREMPEPLMSFEFYGDFIRVTEITDEKERMQSLYNIVEKLPQANHCLLERLIFHLAKVAQQEESNCMSTNALAIIFAPSILRTLNELPTQESLTHVPKQTVCIQCIIESQLKKIRNTLADIRSLDTAAVDANEKLATLRASKRHGNKLTLVENGNEQNLLQPGTPDEDRDIQMLSATIQCLQDKKETLTNQLPALECHMSISEYDMLSTDEVESTGDELEDFDDESVISASDNDIQKVARNLTRHRNKPPPQRTEKYRFMIPLCAPDSPFDLKPVRSDPELHRLGDDEDDNEEDPFV